MPDPAAQEGLVWDALRQIFRDTTIYSKQLGLFLVVCIVGVGLWVARGAVEPDTLDPQAASELPRALAPEPTKANNDYDISIDKTGKVLVNGVEVGGALSFEKENDRFLLVLVREAPSFISSITAQVHLPYPAKDITELRPRIYAIHGVQVSNYRPLDNQSVYFEAYEIYDGATVSIEFTFPKDYFALSPLYKVKSFFSSLPPETWLVIGITLPALTFLFFLSLLYQRFRAYLRVQTKQVSSQPPADLPPAIIGALNRGQIGKKEITATIFDLALRGFVLIHARDDGEIIFTRGKNLYNQSASSLRPFEIFLLHQIFGDSGFMAKESNVEVGLNSELFSSKVAMTLLNIYDAALAEGFFIQSPNRYYLKYKIAGIALFFVGLAALLYGAFTISARGYELFFWVGMILSALMIIWITPGLPRRTARGDASLKQWLAFRSYLTDKSPITQSETSYFFAYLPYAIVLGCEKEWIARWSTQTLVLPSWFSATHALYTADEYGKSMVSVINYLAHNLIASRPPDLA